MSGRSKRRFRDRWKAPWRAPHARYHNPHDLTISGTGKGGEKPLVLSHCYFGQDNDSTLFSVGIQNTEVKHDGNLEEEERRQTMPVQESWIRNGSCLVTADVEWRSGWCDAMDGGRLRSQRLMRQPVSQPDRQWCPADR